MASEGGATGYIVHHLTPLSVGEGFWSVHLDTLFFSLVLGALFIWFFKSGAYRDWEDRKSTRLNSSHRL